MLKLFLKVAAAAILLTGAAACTQIGWGEDLSTPVNAVFRMDVKHLGATDVTMSFYTEADNIASYLVAGPGPAEDCDFINMDGITRLSYIQMHGTSAPAPYEQVLGGLKARTSYYLGAVGVDASGTVVTAPTFLTFRTAPLSVDLSLITTVDLPGNRQAAGAITPDSYVASYNYVIGQDYVTMTDSQLKSLLAAKGEGVRTGSGYQAVSFASEDPRDVVLAVLPYGTDGEAGDLFKAVTSFTSDGPTTFTCGKELAEVAPNVYEGIVFVKAEDNFTIVRNNLEYGFISYSGNGGVGTVTHLFASMPFYALPEGYAQIYAVEKAVGRMAPVEAGGNAFWVNLSAGAQLRIRADFTRETPQYRLEIVPAEDPSLVLKQNFDLFVWGGDYSVPCSGTVPAGVGGDSSIASGDVINYDGTEAGKKAGVNSTHGGTDPFSAPGYSYPCNETFLANRDLVGWDFEKIAEMPGHIRLSKASNGWQGWIQTPKLSALTGTTNITLSFDCGRFGNSAGNILVTIVGNGRFNGGTVDAKGTGSVAVPATGTSFAITGEYCPPYANSVVNKPWSHIVLNIEGADGDTQILWDSRPVPAADCRLRIDNILITK